MCVWTLSQRRKSLLESSSCVDQLTSQNYLWVAGGVCCASQLPAPERRPDLIESVQYPQLVWLIRWCVNEDQNKQPTAVQVIDYLHILQ